MTTLAPFELHRVDSVEEASAAILELGDEAVLYAGGTELLLLLKLGFASYAHLVDIKPIAELSALDAEDGVLHIGAGVRHRQIERSSAVASGWPALAAMERSVANIRVRNVGTLGGNLAFADPHSDPATFLLAADASLVLGLGPHRRTVPMADFIEGPYATALRPAELVVRIDVPVVPDGAALSHLRFATHERPAVTVSTLARVEDERLAEVRIAIGSVGVRPVRVPAAEAMLTGLRADDLDPAVLAAAGAAAAETAQPETDANGSAEYKAHLVGVLVGRGLREAIERARPDEIAA